jgi:hypothetical protein
MSLELRAEFINIFNRTELNNKDSTNALLARVVNSAGVPTSGFGRVNPTGVYAPPRSGQLVARFQFLALCQASHQPVRQNNKRRP